MAAAPANSWSEFFEHYFHSNLSEGERKGTKVKTPGSCGMQVIIRNNFEKTIQTSDSENITSP